jgi:hypothetical protein
VDDPADEVTKRCEHGRNLITRLALQPSYKQFVLDSHNILIRHSSPQWVRLAHVPNQVANFCRHVWSSRTPS